MALTANVERVRQLRGHEVSVLSAGTDVFYKGALVNFSAAGLVIVAADTASTTFAGFVAEYISATTADKVKIVMSEVVVIPLATAAQTDIGVPVFATADDTIALSASNVAPCGRVIDVEVGVSLTIDMAYANTVAS
jgi:hypothetical protein